MIVYHKNSEIDREQWDACIRNCHCVKPYAFSWYLDIMAPGWEALVDDDYDSVFPIPGRSLMGIRYIATPVFLQQLGAYSPDKPPSTALSEFLNYLPGVYRFVDLCVGHKVEYDGFRVTEMVNYELDLSKSYETLRGGFTTHCIRNIEAAYKKKPKIDDDVSPDSLTDLFLRNKGGAISGIKSRDYERLKGLMQFCSDNKKGRILGVRADNGDLIYGMFLVETHGIKTMLFVVNSPESREKRIDYYIVNELIKQNASTRTILDFAGSNIPSVASFMESFGAQNKAYYRLYRNRLLWPVRFVK